MLNPILPVDEANRLKMLKELLVLDTAPEARFDMITHYAATLFQVPIAFISFIDADRQWFKSKCGIEITETPRAFSLCAHAVRANQMLVITDTLVDPRFATHPMVIGKPYIRFYAGAPLRMATGECAGTLCIVDRVPRNIDQDQLGELTELAKLVVCELQGQRISDCFPSCSNLKHDTGICHEFCRNSHISSYQGNA